MIVPFSPNRVSDGNLMVQFYFDRVVKMRITVYNLTGNNVLTTRFYGEKGINYGYHHLVRLPAGNYRIIFEQHAD